MSFYEEYEIDAECRIIPIDEKGWVKYQPEANSFESALLDLLSSTGYTDAGFSDETDDLSVKMAREIPEFYSRYYLNPEEALFVLTGAFPENACYRFKWEDKAYFTMRPDFGLLCILKNLDEPPINSYEDGMRNGLLDVAYEEIEAIYRAIENHEIQLGKSKEAPFDQWINLFRKRRFDLSHIPDKYLTDIGSILIKENEELKEATNNLENENEKLIEDLKSMCLKLKSIDQSVINPRTEKSYLNIIGALLEVISGTSPNMSKHPEYKSEAQLIDYFVEFDLPGLSKSNLEKRFAEAKRSLLE